MDMCVKSYLLASALHGVPAQRLIRRRRLHGHRARGSDCNGNNIHLQFNW